MVSFPLLCHKVTKILSYLFFFFNDTATTEIYTLSLHDALPISGKVIDYKAPYSKYMEIRKERQVNQ